MPRLTILRGISGSGKSTWAREQNAIVVSRDDLRTALFGAEYHEKSPVFECEEIVSATEQATIKVALAGGKDVISDNTNLRPKFAQKIADIGYALGAEVEVKFFDVSFDKAWQRNLMRSGVGGRFVPANIIRKQVESLKNTRNWKPTPLFVPNKYTGTPGKPKAILVDIDGTIAHMRDYRGPFDWKQVGKDDPDFNVMQVITWIRAGMADEAQRLKWRGQEPARVILMSGRDESCRQETFDWAVSWDFNYDYLFMRPAGDMRKDSIVKAELFDKHIRDNYDVVMVFDDRNQVVDMWRAMGLQVAQVAEGDF